MNIHLTDSEIQRLAEDLTGNEKQIAGHLEACNPCKEKYEFYKLLFKEIKVCKSPGIPASFANTVIEMAAQKQEHIIMSYYRLFYGVIIGLSLIAIILSTQTVTIKKIITGFHPVAPGKIGAVETVLIMGAVSFIYVCLIGYQNRFKKEHLLSDITF